MVKNRKKGKSKTETVKKKSLHEAWPIVGKQATEEYGWRPVTQEMERDLNPLTQRRMQDIACYLYDSNPLAHRIPEIMKDFVIGDGYSFIAAGPKLRDILFKFWNDPDNNWEIKQDPRCLDLSLFGEQCYPVFVNKYSGAVKMGYIDPGKINRVKLNRDNPEIVEAIYWQKNKSAIGADRILKVINVDKSKRSKTFGRLIGDCFYFAINKISPTSRGRSDLLCVSDWIDGHDQFLFSRLERAFFMNTFIWDILCEGMDAGEIAEFAKTMPAPKPGSMRFHNEKVKWNAVTPKLEAQDASAEARMFKNQILGGKGFPEHWFAEGSTTTRATALEMSLPTLKMLKSRQRFFTTILKQQFNFVVDQAIIHGELDPKKDNLSFSIIPSPIIAKDIKGIASSLNSFTTALKTANEAGWASDAACKQAFQTYIGQLGVQLKEMEEMSEKNEEYKKAKKGKQQ